MLFQSLEKQSRKGTDREPNAGHVRGCRLVRSEAALPLQFLCGVEHGKRIIRRCLSKILAALIDVLPTAGERAVLWADVCMRCSLANRQDLCERLGRDYLKPALAAIPVSDTAYARRVLIEVAPALYKVHATTCSETVESLGAPYRDYALKNIIGFLLERRVPSDPVDELSTGGRETTYDSLVEVCKLTEAMETDWMIYRAIAMIGEVIRSNKNKLSINIPQREDIARRLRKIVEEKLPIRRQISHHGYQVIALAQIYRMRQATADDWSEVVQRGEGVPNTADRALVLYTIALCLPKGMAFRREQLIKEAKRLVAEIPSDLERIERYVGFAEEAHGIDNAMCREFITAAVDVLAKTKEDIRAHRRRVVDLAFRLDEDFARSLIDKIDDDVAKQAAKTQVALLKARENIVDEKETGTALAQVGTGELPKLGWLLVRGLRAGRVQSFPPSSIRDRLELADGKPLRAAYSLIVWYIENAVDRFSKTGQASSFLRPMFEATVVGAELAGHVAGKTLARLKAVREQSGELSDRRGSLVHAQTREQAVQALTPWVEKTAADFLKIVDPYFGPSDLEWLQAFRSVKADCRMHVLTSRRHQPVPADGHALEDVYAEYWRRNFDQKPPKAEITIIGLENSKESPIHDRWILTKEAGVRIGTSLNSLGTVKESDISEMTPEDVAERLAEIDQYLTREKQEHGGQRVRITSFWL